MYDTVLLLLESTFSHDIFLIVLEGPEGVKWELGFAYFWVGKWDFMHWDWVHQQKKPIENGNGIKIRAGQPLR